MDNKEQSGKEEARELLIQAQRETIELQRQRLKLQATVFTKMFEYVKELQQQMEAMLQN
ncbi:MAG: hypothetical protein ACRC2O_17505 [Chitinophagaceae bacterium]